MRKWIVLILPLMGFLMLSGCHFRAAQIDKEKNARAHVSLGRENLLGNRQQEAFVEFQKALEFDPDNRDAHYFLGHIYFERKQYEGAEKEFQAVVKATRDDSEAYNYLGFVYLTTGKTDDAIKAFRQALKNPTYATPEKPHYNLAWAYHRQGKVAEAMAEYREAIRINPAYVQPHYELGRLLLQQGDIVGAIEEFNIVLKTYPDDISTHFALGEAYYKQKDYARARTEFDRVITLDSSSDLASEGRRYIGIMKNFK